MKEKFFRYMIYIMIIMVIFTLYSCKDKLEPSQSPPGGLAVNDVPQFVTIGFDDNAHADSLNWIYDYASKLKNHAGTGNKAVYDGEPVTFSFYSSGKHGEKSGAEWKKLYDAGHEVGNHTYKHAHGCTKNMHRGRFIINMYHDDWIKDITRCTDVFDSLGIDTARVTGFRTPFLGYTEYTFSAIKELGFTYDCSIREGFQEDQDGTNFFWPYTLHNGSPGDVVLASWLKDQYPLESYPGIWEMPNYVLIIPPDEECEKYGVEPGFRERTYEIKKYLKERNWKITGFDYNVFFNDRGNEPLMTPNEFAAVLKYSLDLRLKGNRAPFMFGAHIDYYHKPERKKALVNFIEYALSKPEVRIVSTEKILQWIKEPVPFS